MLDAVAVALQRRISVPSQKRWFATQLATAHVPSEQIVPVGQSVGATQSTQRPSVTSHSCPFGVHCLSEVHATGVMHCPAAHVCPGLQSAPVTHSTHRCLVRSHTALVGQSSE